MKALARKFSIFPESAVDQGCGVRAADVDLAESSRDLEANILVLQGVQQEPIVLVSIDALYPGAQLADAARRGARGLQPERVMIGATHTHAAPMTDHEKPPLGAPDQRHMAVLSRQLESAITQMLEEIGESESSQLHCGSGLADHSINRRRRQAFVLSKRPRMSHIAIAPNLTGSRDETITLFTVSDMSGTPVAVVWNYACHPVAQPSPEQYSSHFPGLVRARIRRWFGEPTLPVLYFQGFSGDTRPSASVRKTTLVECLRNAGRRVAFDRMSSDVYSEWSASLGDRVIDVLSRTRVIPTDGIEASSTLEPGDQFIAGQAHPVLFQAVALGPELTILGIGAEPVSSYAHWVRSAVDSTFVMCVGCVDQTYGYLPTATVLQEGGYEGGEFCAVFGLGQLSATVDSTARAAVRRVLDRVDVARP